MKPYLPNDLREMPIDSSRDGWRWRIFTRGEKTRVTISIIVPKLAIVPRIYSRLVRQVYISRIARVPSVLILTPAGVLTIAVKCHISSQSTLKEEAVDCDEVFVVIATYLSWTRTGPLSTVYCAAVARV